ncbi:MAG TPA: hypothetical protein VN641_01455 [Urbifossiella sp.]|nr:hypothetical protein [Urbifossiella sp.]
MTLTFDLRKSLVVVPVFVAGPEGGQNFDFAVDTGASRSSLNGLFLEALGYRRTRRAAIGRFEREAVGWPLVLSP